MHSCRCRVCNNTRQLTTAEAPSEMVRDLARDRISPDTLYTADDVAVLVRVSRKVVYAMADAGQLPAAVRIGRRMRFRGADLLRWLENLQKTR